MGGGSSKPKESSDETNITENQDQSPPEISETKQEEEKQPEIETETMEENQEKEQEFDYPISWEDAKEQVI